MRRVWRFHAVTWEDEHRLRGCFANSDADAPLLLNLRTGRMVVAESGWVDGETGNQNGAEEDTDEDSRPSLLPILNAALEGPADPLLNQERRFVLGGHPVHLIWSLVSDGRRHPLVAASDEAAPRVLRLTDDGVPLQLDRDGRTLFFLRRNVLWRLDLRKPLPQLLDEVARPGLPIPTELLESGR
jgi:hypothetical protein